MQNKQKEILREDKKTTVYQVTATVIIRFVYNNEIYTDYNICTECDLRCRAT